MASHSRTIAAGPPDNVITLQPPFAKTVPFVAAGGFTFPVRVKTDALGWTTHDATIYREEILLVDPDAELEDGCLVVAQMKNGSPHLQQWWRMGRDCRGRFVRPGDPRESFQLSCGLSYTRDEVLRFIRIIGRVVGVPRRF